MAENENQTDPLDGGVFHSLVNDKTGQAKVIYSLEKPGLRRRLVFATEYRRDRLLQSFQTTYHFEIERGLAFNFVPILMGVGIIVYFLAPAEPFTAALVALVVGLVFAVRRSNGAGVLFRMISASLCVFLGMLVGKLAVIQSEFPSIRNQMTGSVSGTIISVDENSRGSPRYRIAPDAIEGLRANELPRYIRVSSAGRSDPYEPGVQINGVARLQPVLGPAYPGGYDFSFFSRFNGIGGSGFFMGKPSRAEVWSQTLSKGDQIKVEINRFRLFIKKRIETALPGETGKIATALVIGDRSGIPNDAQDALRATGLAHILAISGLHMALVALTTLWVLRLLLSLNGRLVLHYPVKKWAAIGAFIMATGYLMISGFGVATQRAWIMISIMLVAVLLDRRAITLRNVAISATIILIVDPASLLAPGFQMSFAAVVALVSAYEVLNHRRRQKLEEKQFDPNGGIFATSMRSIGIFTGGLFTTSLVAGLATSFIAAWHFHQVAPLGLLANLLAMPIVTLFVMPAVLFSIVLIPLGLDPLSLILVSNGINAILQIAFWVNDLMPVVVTGIQNLEAFFLFTLGFGILTLFKSKFRLIGLAFIFVIPLFSVHPDIPDILIAENGRSVAIKTEEGTLGTLLPKRENFVTKIWGKAYAKTTLQPVELSKEECDRERCIFRFPSGTAFYLVYAPDLLGDACENANILAAPRLKWVSCKGRQPDVILKREDFESKGAHEVYFQEANDTNEPSHIEIAIKTAFGSVQRPWHRKSVTYQD